MEVKLVDTYLDGKVPPENEEELSVFVETWWPRLVRFVAQKYGFALTLQDIEDVIQDSLAVAWESLSTGTYMSKGYPSFVIYLKGVIRHKAIDALRQVGTHKDLYTSSIDDFEEVLLGEPSPEDSLMEAEDSKILLEKVPLTSREAVILRHIYGYSKEEIARMLNIKPEAVKKRLGRGIKHLKMTIEQDLAFPA